jgi:hypothetical protein
MMDDVLIAGEDKKWMMRKEFGSDKSGSEDPQR